MQIQLFAKSPQVDKSLVFEIFTNNDGLSHGNIRCIFQDSKGFLWIGTNAGLNRFDGKDFLVFKNDPQDPKSISSNNIFGICEDNNRNLWIATEHGFNQIIRDTYECNRYYIDTTHVISTESNIIQNIFCDNTGNIWIKNPKSIVLFNLKTGKMRPYHFPTDIFKEEYDFVSYPIFQDSQGILWIGTDNGLGYYEPMNDAFIFFREDDHCRNHLSNNRVLSIFEDAQKNLWIGTENGLNLFDKKSQKFHHYFYAEQSQSVVNGIADGYSRNTLWLTTECNGLYKFDTETKKFSHIAHTAQKQNISTNQTNCVFKSTNNILWIGTQNGLNKLDLKPKRFQLLGNEDYTVGVKHNYTSAICIEKNLVFFGTKFGGLQIYDLERQSRHTFSADHGNFPSNYITSIIKYSDNEILIGSDGYLMVYNIRNKSLRSIDEKIPELHSFCIAKKRIKCLLRDSHGNLWIGTNFGILRYSQIDRSVTHFDKKDLPSNQVNCLFEDHKGTIYIGTENGFCLYSNKSGFSGVEISSHYTTSMHKRIYDITEDYNGTIWLGSNVGLIEYNPGSRQCNYFSTKDGLSSNEIFSMLTNGKDLWLGIDNGLSIFKPDSLQCKTFSLHDGIQDYEFSPHSAVKASNGFMFFGGTQGINIFHPDSIHLNKQKPNLEFLGMEYYDKDELFSMQIKNEQEITIPWKSNNIKIYFAALEYTKPLLNQYKYYLEGRANGWISLGNQNHIRIIKLPPGTYTLHIKASNDDDVWCDEKTLKIIVPPPFWRTPLAYTLEFAALILFICFIILKVTQKTRKENRRLLERQVFFNKIEEQKKEIEAKNQNILDSINYAQRIQFAIMPARAKFRHLLPSSFILYLPKDIVSGDFYWITEIDSKIIIACSDCTGHGVPGAFMSIIGYNLLRSITKDKRIHNAAAILNYLNKSLIELLSKNELEDNTSVKDGMDIAICVFDKETCVLEFAGALAKMLIFRNNQMLTIRGDKYPVGLNNEQDKPYTNAIIRVQDDDRFYMFSDGYADQFGGPDGKKMKFKRFKANIQACQHLPLPKQGIELKKQLQQWQGSWEQLDDILVMGFDFNVYLQKKREREMVSIKN